MEKGNISPKTTMQIRASSFETVFYYRENMSEKRVSAETASTSNKMKKYDLLL